MSLINHNQKKNKIHKSEQEFLNILVDIHTRLSWRKWESCRTAPKQHPLYRSGDQEYYLHHRSVESVLEMPESVFRFTLKLVAVYQKRKIPDPFGCRHYFSLGATDLYSHTGRKDPIKLEYVFPSDTEYAIIKELFESILEIAFECETNEVISRNQAIATLNYIFQKRLLEKN